VGRSLRIGTAFGIGVYVHWTFLLIVFLALASAASGDLVTAFAIIPVFGCIVLHELGHALMARSYGIGTRDITLLPIGGVARLEQMIERPSEEVAIAVAGPLVNVVIAVGLGVGMALSGNWTHFDGSLAAKLTVTLLVWNVVMVLFNLIPAFPMDGGRVLRAVLAMGLGRLRGTEIAVGVSKVLAVLFIAVGVTSLMPGLSLPYSSPFLAVIGLFVLVAGDQELAMLRYQSRPRASRLTIDQPPAVLPVQPPVHPAQPEFSGFIWDPRAGAWIEWRNGQMVGATYVNGAGPYR
jgi:Zn-dependent protease